MGQREIARRLVNGIWRTIQVEEESGNGGSITAIDLSDIAATEFQQLVFDSRGIGSLGFATQLDDVLDPGTDHLLVYVLTRLTGRPWTVALISQSIAEPSGITLAARLDTPSLVGTNGQNIENYLSGGPVGLLDETCIIAQPAGAGPQAAMVSLSFGGSSIDFNTDTTPGDFNNQASVEIVDPGVPNSLLEISSTTGWDFVIEAETDAMGNIVTAVGDIGEIWGSGLHNYSWYLYAVSVGVDLVTATANTPLTGGTSDAAGVTYSVKGTY